ncbi:hypothetical protein PTSG_00221 [Salpingoeca rosetta]|uniref:GH18 domain-containing protein n=1 Tax=Salpingoeca rosetta (strain ATCC 50818 / BSB-021) TaxID=946362 RepID=F2TVV3_SALR5|nr:uncharacterized protein PTSG_00221 [Salpingoeca rosetta]EGD72199.1 hypothetical protein PTSG_00221 [Salpingoeca rosetta]|eukprot:XP_004998770.1 hypothetical protein PTSG_00221 [Salpingoeca rosetta]
MMMMSVNVVLLLLLVAVVVIGSSTQHAAAAAPTAACPCQDASLCKPIQGQRPEIFGFTAQYWRQFNFSLATTIAWSDDPDLVCHAHAHGVRVVLQQYMDIGVPADKIVLGLPWYGYDYPCLNGGNASARYCEIKRVPFRGAPCSDAAGTERGYGDLWQVIHNSSAPTTPVMYDDLLVSKYFNYRHTDGTLHQVVWFDDPSTLQQKFALAKTMGLRGVGVWNFDLLDYSTNDPRVHAATRDMWNAFNAFLQP